jgi:hypothetical protein
MKKIIFFVLSLAFFLPVYGNEKEAPFLISTQNLPNPIFRDIPMPAVEIVSKADLLTIQDVNVNRGNCKRSTNNLPKKLKFGEKVLFVFNPQCNVIQINVKTDQGSWEFNKQ